MQSCSCIWINSWNMPRRQFNAIYHWHVCEIVWHALWPRTVSNSTKFSHLINDCFASFMQKQCTITANNKNQNKNLIFKFCSPITLSLNQINSHKCMSICTRIHQLLFRCFYCMFIFWIFAAPYYSRCSIVCQAISLGLLMWFSYRLQL